MFCMVSVKSVFVGNGFRSFLCVVFICCRLIILYRSYLLYKLGIVWLVVYLLVCKLICNKENREF